MKNVKIFTMAVAALILGLTGCSKDGERGADKVEEGSKNITISFNEANVSSRAIDGSASNGTTKTTFSSGQLVFANKGQVTDVFAIQDTPTNLANKVVNIGELTSTTGVTFPKVRASDVFVIGNTTLTLSAGSSINNDLLGAKLTTTHLKGGKYEDAVLYGTAKVIESSVTPNPIGNKDYYAKVTIKPLAARFEILKLTEINTEYDYKYKLEAIYINNYYEKMTVGGETSELTTWLAGQFPGTGYVGTTGALHDIIGSSDMVDNSAPEAGKVWAYNMFPAKNVVDGDDKLPHIIVHMKNLTRDGELVYENYYLTIATYGDVKNIEAGKVYTIENIEFDGAKHGDIDPETKLIDCDVAVSVAPWEPAVLVPDVN